MSDDKETYTYQLPSGATVEIEGLTAERTGAANVSAGDAEVPAQFEKLIKPLGEIADLLANALKSVNEPDSINLEFGASIKGGTNWMLVSGEAEGTIKVSLTWDNNKPKSD